MYENYNLDFRYKTEHCLGGKLIATRAFYKGDVIERLVIQNNPAASVVLYYFLVWLVLSAN